MVLGLQVVFSALDRLAFPELFLAFLGVRMAVNALLLSILFWLRFSHPRLSQNAMALALGGEIMLMIYATGGPASDYYAGLIILSVGMPVMLPYRRREASAITGVFFVGYAVSPLFVAVDYALTPFLTSLVFIASGCIECVISCGILMRARIVDFEQRAELERARDRLTALDEAKARFSANVHHELRTPLTLILAPLDSMRAGDYGETSEPVARALRTMHINGQRLLKMINNLLDLAKVESQSFEIHRRQMDLVGLLREVVEGAEDLARRKGLELALELPAEGMVRIVNADPDALEKVLMNLVGNALKFTETGGRITLSIETAVAVDGYDGVRVAVTDTGVGLPADQLEKIFDRFSQVDGSATRKHEGTGIGLSLALELVELHGGRIWAESEGPGRGTSMQFLLPVGEVDDEVEEDVLRDESGQGVKLARSMQALEGDLQLDDAPGARARFVEMERSVRRWEAERNGSDETVDASETASPDAPEVLIVEDNPDMRELLSFLVGREYRIRTAKNGREGLDRLGESIPDLVLTDVMMPEMSGTELCRAIKSNPETSMVPVILVTSKAEDEMKVEGLELGADDYVTKPFHPRELMARVRTLVTQRCLRRELAEQNAELEAAMGRLGEAQVQLVQAERLAAVGELAAGIAHEVNNPVNFALNAVRALTVSVGELQEFGTRIAALDFTDEAKLEGQIRALHKLADELGVADLTEALGELAEIIADGLTRTHSLVGDLRDFAAPGSRGERRSVDIGRGLASTVQLLKHMLRDANAMVVVSVDEDLPDVQGDAGALNQVFLNLIKNAAESFGGRGGEIQVEASALDGTVHVVVRDNGPGMPPAVLERLFEPFFSTKEPSHGTGLGLSICQQIAESHGGALEAESQEGRGTTMSLMIPIAGRVASSDPADASE